MDESQPRQQPQAAQGQKQSQTQSQHQPPKQQQRTRSRLTADGQTSRRPRAVAGQRAAAKRATVVEPMVPESRVPVEPKTAAPEPIEFEPVKSELAESDLIESEPTESETSEPETPESTEPAASTKRTKSDARTARTPRPTRTTRTARRAIVTAVLAVALITAVAVGAVFAVQYRNAIRTDHARTAAIAAAERVAPVIFSYDYRHLDQDFSKAEAYLTGAFRGQYEKTTQTVVKPTALQYHGVVQATVAKPADGSTAAVSVVSAAPDQVVVLAFIDQSTTSTRVTGTQVDQNRVLLTLTHTSQGWLVSAVDAL